MLGFFCIFELKIIVMEIERLAFNLGVFPKYLKIENNEHCKKKTKRQRKYPILRRAK